jgi:hypothetical protein
LLEVLKGSMSFSSSLIALRASVSSSFVIIDTIFYMILKKFMISNAAGIGNLIP